MDNLPNPFSKLPRDIWVQLTRMLDLVPDIWNLSQVSKSFSQHFDEEFWKTVFAEWMEQNQVLSQPPQNRELVDQIERNLQTHCVFKHIAKNVWKQRCRILLQRKPANPSLAGYCVPETGILGLQPFNEFPFWIIGDTGVGKSALTIQWINWRFVDMYDPTIEDSYRKQLVVDETTCLVDIWDTADQADEDFRKLYLDKNLGTILIFAINNRDSFQNIHKYIALCKNKKYPTTPIILVGCKRDLENERTVGFGEGLFLAKMFGMSYFEISNKTRFGVEELLSQMVREIRSWCQTTPLDAESLPFKVDKQFKEILAKHQKFPKKRREKPVCILQ